MVDSMAKAASLNATSCKPLSALREHANWAHITDADTHLLPFAVMSMWPLMERRKDRQTGVANSPSAERGSRQFCLPLWGLQA